MAMTELRTRRLLLRRFREDDLEAFASFADDEAYRRFLGSGHPSAAQLVANNVAVDWEREPSWAILLDGRVVGSIFLGVHMDDATGELACLLAPDVWGQGIAVEAGRAVTDYAFGVLKLDKVWARAEANNAASRRAMEKGGMRQEGLLRSHRTDRSGNRVDEVVFGLTRDDWRAANQA
jgi:RimJ/RimL family protein N-acetyltransferase